MPPFDRVKQKHKKIIEKEDDAMNKVVDINTALDHVKSGDSIMVGGFASSYGTPFNLLSALAEKDVKHLITISEDFHNGMRKYGAGLNKLLKKGMVDELILSFLNRHPDVQEKVDAGAIKVTLVPQGTLAERIRAGGAGLGGFYTPTGVGTIVEEGKETKVINGKKYLLELPLRANVALIKCRTADTMGNALFAYTARNFNYCMAMAADIVIMECEHLVQPGDIPPDMVHLPGIFVDYVVHCEGVSD